MMQKYIHILLLLFLSSTFFCLTACGSSSSSSSNGGTDSPSSVIEDPAEKSDITAAFELILSDDSDYDASNTDFVNNLDLLANAILTAGGEQGIRKAATNLNRIVRYILFTYGITAYSDFIASDFSTKISGLDQDALIGKIGRTTATYSVAVPLDESELPGDDKAKRVAYYYNADISYYAVAEEIISLVRDDTINDAIMLEMATIKAKNGLFEDAELIIEAQIYSSQYKGDGYRKLADWLITYGKSEDAVPFLEKAETFYKKIINAEGEGNIVSQDTGNLQSLASSYREAEEYDKAEAILEYLADIATTYATATTYGRLIVGTYKVIDEYLEEDPDAAAPLVDTLYEYCQAYPANDPHGEHYYQAKIYFLIVAAEYYVAIDTYDKIDEIYTLIKSIRENDGFATNWTASQTWVYMDRLVEVLYRAGYDSDAIELAQSIPDSYEYYKYSTSAKEWQLKTKDASSYQVDAFKPIATFKAVEDGLGTVSATQPATLSAMSAVDIITYLLSSDREKVEALTFYNDTVPYIAAVLIEKGDTTSLARAKEALEMAESILDSMTESTEANTAKYIVQWGYARVALLYYRLDAKVKESDAAGDSAAISKATENLVKGKNIIAGLTGAAPVVDGYIALSDVYFLLDERTTAKELLSAAVIAADSYASSNVGSDESVYAAELYNDIAKQYLAYDEKDTAKDVIAKSAACAAAIYSDGGSEDDKLDEVKYLIKAANLYVKAGTNEAATALLATAEITAELVANLTDRIECYIEQGNSDSETSFDSIIEAYAYAADFDRAKALANAITTSSERNLGLQRIAETYCLIDDFPNTDVASVDTDGDGKPDFFHPLATEDEIIASGLELDDDCDGDGIKDSLDSRPLYADN